MTVRELLDASHAAHNQYRLALKDKRADDAAEWLTRAGVLRLDAQAADPEYTDSAWRDESAKFPHAALMKFYADAIRENAPHG